MLQHSAFCEGSIAHRRFSPKANQFRYQVFMAWLDVDELSMLDDLPFWSTKRFNLVQYRRKDFISPGITNLKDAVYSRLREESVTVETGKVFLLTHLRSWGYSFNPVSFYYCFNSNDRLYAVVAEITNTPWLEKHSYVLPVGAQNAVSEPAEFRFAKAFHVSPFMPMAMAYQWRFQLVDDRVFVHMKLFKGSELVFDASLGLNKGPLNKRTAVKAALTYPFITSKVVALIYWQAFKLWCKQVPIHDHPRETLISAGEIKDPVAGKPVHEDPIAGEAPCKEAS